MRGRKPSAEHLSLVPPPKGENAVAALPEKPAASARAARISAPSHLPAQGKREFERLQALLEQNGKWSPLFVGPLTIYAEAWAEWIEAKQKLSRRPANGGGKVIMSPNNFPIQSTWLNIRNKAAETMMAVGKEMGLTLISQVRVANAQLDLFADAPAAATGTDDSGGFDQF